MFKGKFRSYAKVLALSVIVLQVAALLYMAGEREYLRAFGRIVVLQTAPIDPRDPFRGDFVRLRYDFSSLKPEQLGLDSDDRLGKGEVIYAALKPSGEARYELDYFSREAPADGVFLKGRTTYDYNFMRFGGVGVKYGIEQYFVEQGQGLLMEERLGARGEMQVPMEVEVAVGTNGDGVIRDYRWSDLGVRLQIPRANARDFSGNWREPDAPASPLLRITYQNVSDKKLMLVDGPAHCTLHLVPLNSDIVVPPPEQCGSYSPTPEDLIELEVGAIYQIELDMSESRWHVRMDGELKEMGQLDNNKMFRIVYRLSDAGEALPDQVWRGSLGTQAFNAVGAID